MKNKKWTYEESKILANLCTSKKEFIGKYRNVYYNALKYGWKDDICSHMKDCRKPVNYWTYDRLKNEALKYKTRKEFTNGNISAYNKASRNNILDDICSHMLILKHKWTKGSAISEAKKYDTISHFQKYNSGAYQYIKKHKLDIIAFSHMIYTGHKYLRGVYTYKILFNNIWYAYSGLTYNFHKRYITHLSDIKNKKIKNTTMVDKFCVENCLDLPMYEIYFDYVDVETARKLEQENLQKLEQDGFIILNKNKTGGIGFENDKYSFEKAQEVILTNNINFRKELEKLNASLYRYCIINNYIDILLPNKKYKVYSFDIVKKFICENNIKNRSHLSKINSPMYQHCRKNNYLEDFFPINSKYSIYDIHKYFLENNIKNKKDLINLNMAMYTYCRRKKLLNYFFPKLLNNNTI